MIDKYRWDDENFIISPLLPYQTLMDRRIELDQCRGRLLRLFYQPERFSDKRTAQLLFQKRVNPDKQQFLLYAPVYLSLPKLGHL